MKKTFLLLLMAVVAIGPLRAQIYDENGQYVDTIFHDHINRQAEDFVKAYLCIAEPTDWKDDFLGVNGHAFIRLVCDTFGMDYCFSYESESVDGQMDKYLKGQLKMGMFAIPTEEYLVDYRTWNRAVHQYKLNLPPDAKQRLWEILDNRVMEGNQLKLDLERRGCAISAVRYIKRALGDKPIIYPTEIQYYNMTRSDMLYRDMANVPWIRLVYSISLQDSYIRDCSIDEKMILPKDVAEVWQRSTLLGKPMIEYDKELVEAPKVIVSAPFVTPLRLAWFWLILTIVLTVISYSNSALPHKINTIILLIIQILLGCALLYLWLFTQMFSTSAAILMLFFSPLPAICWKWRQYWQLPLAIVYLIAIIFLLVWPHMIIDPAFLVFSLCFVVLFSAEPIYVIVNRVCCNK